MDTHLNRLGQRLLPDWPVAGVSLCALGVGAGFVRGALVHVADRLLDRRVRAELEAYARLEVRKSRDGDVKGLGRRVCGLVAEVSAFQRVAMLTKDSAGRLVVAASVGMDEGTLGVLSRWGTRVLELEDAPRRGTGMRRVAGIESGSASAGLELDGVEVWLAPMWSTAGRILGAMAVCRMGQSPADAAAAIRPLEGLAAKLARSLENAELAERLMRSERMAGLGQMAGGLVHALNNPLTAVLGYAEIIAETADEPRVRAEATTIVREAVRMQATMQDLMGMWQANPSAEEDVDLKGLIEELRGECAGTLAGRGVRLTVELDDDVPEVRGNRAQVRVMLEHLLNRAAEAVAARQEETEHSIRVILRQDERGVQLMVSDTGLGFAEPARVFDPLFTGGELGLGMSLCSGMVRELGGEISAYNLHPRGSAVVVEFPVEVTVGC